MKRPELKIEKDNFDKIVEALTWLGVFKAFFFPAFYYSDLPEQIPIHFNAAGEADRYDHVSMIWLFPMILFVLIFGVSKLMKYPHHFNYLKKITAENAEATYRNTLKMMRTFNLIISLSFAYISIQTVLVSLQKSDGLGNGFKVVFVIAIVVFPLLPFVFGRGSKKPEKGSSQNA